ncbi:DMT family transporter [Phaeobacter sp. QD34_3]|uniref:DMT family transporter n=1 Tax=unclassified Phaeobacter TaxID=2621772 RepID=UPI00237F8181|nr:MULTISPECIES: DMT family transporter [unclassified Phaeobacter]MDE4131927.1 DMT family transporter [Phaeobacter sp. QD34_3]MDE4135565.1 DMT family transporter [Phaeobacter sp. QD34_24]MDE4173554.1 DMT family transporter [Phaeobacter sp. PT47_59]
MSDAQQIEKPAQNPVMGIFWMLVTGLCFVAVTALVKHLGGRIPPAESAFLRYLLGLVFLIPMVGALRRARLTPRLWGLFAGRGALHTLGVMLWFFAMTRIPLAEVTAMNYLAPVYVTLGAALFLGEKLALRRIAAIVAALIGAIIILRPGFREVSPGHIAMLVAAVVFGGSYLLAKFTVDGTNPTVVVAMLSLWVTAGLAPFAMAVWVTPTLAELAILFGVACFATAGHYTMTLAFSAAPVAVTQPVTFLQLIWATLLGALVFDEAVDIWVVSGGALILAAISFITWREAVLKRRAITPPVPATKV